MYVVIDDCWQQIAPLFRRPGPEPACSDSELITLAVVAECCGWDQETEALQHWQAYRHLFPNLPERSRFNRRHRALAQAINLIRCTVLSQLDVAQDRYCVIDSLPVPVIQFHLVPGAGSKADWQAAGATFGKVTSKQQTIFGYKLHLLVTLGGVIRDFVLAPAHAADGPLAEEVLEHQTDLVVVGDKAYISAERAARLWHEQRIAVLAPRKANQQPQNAPEVQRMLNRTRQMIETVNGQLQEQFHLETNHAYQFSGLCARLYTKLTAHTLCIYLNRLLDNADFLQIKQLAFPNG
jgi:IS5 family transposase